MAKKFAVIGRAAELAGYRLIVTGSRYWTNIDKVYDAIHGMLMVVADKGFEDRLIIVHGGAKGADTIAGKVAQELGLAVEVHPADWDKYGKRAGPIRNQLMLDESHRLAFFDGYRVRCAVAFHENLAESKGTADMVGRLEAAGIPVLKVA